MKTIQELAKEIAAYAHPDTRDMVESAAKEALTQIQTQAREEGQELEITILKTHLDRQIYQNTVDTDSIYAYIEKRFEVINEHPKGNKDGGDY